MESISRKEAFECAMALSAAVAKVVNSSKTDLADFALCLRKKSLSPIICLQPGAYFQWKDDGKYGEYSYAFIPIPPYSDIFLSEIGRVMLNVGGKLEKVKASQIAAPWIKEVLAKQYLKLTYQCGMLMNIKLQYDHSILGKTHSDWIKFTLEDDIIYYLPYYTKSERAKLFATLPPSVVKQLEEEYWYE